MIRPVQNIVQINNNREPRGFDKAPVYHISEIRYAKKMDKYLADQEPKQHWIVPYLQIISFFGLFLILGGLLAELVVR
jgi:hypothetical protein